VFADLIGQDALVRTLTNAIASGRIAQGYMLTGVRGVGKTTTARLIARALNCVGPDGTGGPTASPCGVCVHCVDIAEDRHLDVLELDAASRSKVEEMRELLDGVRYRPVSARYKIYIVDEVHMLSTHAFNALLKTLEEPPDHVKFIFATTEIRKVPVTILSRCQRFDLRRIDMAHLAELFSRIAAQEGAKVDAHALALIARAADGSARDGLSILDQAISLAAGDGAASVGEQQVRDMLGLADRARVFDLFEAVMKGDVKTALDMLADQYAAGAAPVVVIQDLLELTHWLTRLRVAPDGANDPALAETERTRGVTLAQGLSLPTLTRAWQMLLKGLSEVRAAPMPLQAAEMVLVRLAYAADLPSPADAIKSLGSGGTGSGGAVAARPAAPAPAPPSPATPGPRAMVSGGGSVKAPVPSTAPSPAMQPETMDAQATPAPQSFVEVVALFDQKRESRYAALLKRQVRLVRFAEGIIEFNPLKGTPADLAGQVGKLLTQWTGQRWVASVVNTAGAPTLHDQEIEQAKSDPVVKSILEAWPDAKVEAVRSADT
jgi:DNA polymerase-3 subunit gamma/tau